jgi:nitrate reductase delta subunit
MDTKSTACDRLADALSYPVGDFAATIAACRTALSRHAPLAGEEVATFQQATAPMTLAGLQELYTSTFDLNPAATLDVGWHVFGESYDRGSFLATLRADLRAAGVAETSELPDHLPQLLRLIGRSAPVPADEFASLVSLALERVTPVLESDRNPYVHLLRAVAAALPSGPTVVGPTFRLRARLRRTAEAPAEAVRSGVTRPGMTRSGDRTTPTDED